VKQRQRLVLQWPRSTAGLHAIPLMIQNTARISIDYGQVNEIAGGTAVDLSLMGTDGISEQVSAYGDRIFGITDEDMWLYHMGVAVVADDYTPLDDMKVYYGFGHSTIQQGLDTDVTNKPTESGPLGDRGFEWSQHTVHKAGSTETEMIPTDAIEIFSFKDNSNYIGFKNETGGAVTPRLYIYGRAYSVKPIKQVSEEKARKAALGKVPSEPRTITQLARDTKVTIPKKWRPCLVKIDEDGFVADEENA